MFERWGFLLSEIWVLLVLAALLGLIVGWLIWGRRPVVVADTSDADRLRIELQACTARAKDMSGRIAGMERDLAATDARARDAESRAVAAKISAPPAPAPSVAAPILPAQNVAAPVMAAPAPKAATAPVMAAPAPAPAATAAPLVSASKTSATLDEMAVAPKGT